MTIKRPSAMAADEGLAGATGLSRSSPDSARERFGRERGSRNALVSGLHAHLRALEATGGSVRRRSRLGDGRSDEGEQNQHKNNARSLLGVVMELNGGFLEHRGSWGRPIAIEGGNGSFGDGSGWSAWAGLATLSE